MKRFAWMPGNALKMADALAVPVHPEDDLTSQTWLALLAMRVQALVDRTPDPQEATNEFQETLTKAGYFPDSRVDAGVAGAALILSNDVLMPVLWMREAIPVEFGGRATKPVPAAAMALEADRTQAPEARLRRIASLLALPTSAPTQIKSPIRPPRE